MTRPPEYWLAQTPMTQLGSWKHACKDLPGDVRSLMGIVQELLVHGDWLGLYGVAPDDRGPMSRVTLPVSERIESHGLGLCKTRPLAARSVGTCRDFALTL